MGHGTVMKPPVHMISVNQRSIVNPVADKAALSRFYRSLITGTLEPTVTFVWPLGWCLGTVEPRFQRIRVDGV